MNRLTAGVDYYTLPDGRLVFTETYHLKRGFCCGKGCRHCPYSYMNVEEPKRSQLLEQRKQNEQTG